LSQESKLAIPFCTLFTAIQECERLCSTIAKLHGQYDRLSHFKRIVFRNPLHLKTVAWMLANHDRDAEAFGDFVGIAFAGDDKEGIVHRAVGIVSSARVIHANAVED
jgi:hypothetical protein